MLRVGIVAEGQSDWLVLEVVMTSVHADIEFVRLQPNHPCPPASETAVALSKVIEIEWLQRDPKPEYVVIATPAQSSDAWIVATLDPPYANLADIECDKSVEDELIKSQWGDIKRLRKREGEVKKSASAYIPFAKRVGQNIETVCTHCPQAEAFRSNFQVAVTRSLPPQQAS